jgi:hypothetical protein
VLAAIAVAFLAGCATPPLDNTRDQSPECEVHHVGMAKMSVPISYGLPAYSKRTLARFKASTNSFPHADDWVGGGCVVTRHSPKEAIVFVCPDCQRAAQEWEIKYGAEQ